MPDSLRRALRTLFQAGTAGVIVACYQAFVHPLTPEQAAAALAGLTVVITFGQNALEDAGAIPAMGKAPASPGANPVPDPAQHLEVH
jgi:hypothetical protein